MSMYEYSVVPSPRKGKSGRGVKGKEAKFANAVSAVMNEMGAAGWEYLRADTLPFEERQGLTSKTVKYHSMLVFRRLKTEIVSETSSATETLATLSAPAAIAEIANEPPLTAIEAPNEVDPDDVEPEAVDDDSAVEDADEATDTQRPVAAE